MKHQSVSLLLVEDHYDLAATLMDFLQDQGFIVDHARSIQAAKHFLVQQAYHVLLLDINLPDGNGYELCQWLREECGLSIPVIMLTARDTLKDKLNGFAVGTDDYLVKPFDLSELLVRVQAMIKRSRGEVAHVRWQVADLILNTADQTVTRAGQAIELAPIQFKLLALLMRQSPQVVNRQTMMVELWGEEKPESDALRSHIYNLRKQIDKPFEQKLLHTVSGIGLKVAADIMTNDETALES